MNNWPKAIGERSFSRNGTSSSPLFTNKHTTRFSKLVRGPVREPVREREDDPPGKTNCLTTVRDNNLRMLNSSHNNSSHSATIR